MLRKHCISDSGYLILLLGGDRKCIPPHSDSPLLSEVTPTFLPLTRRGLCDWKRPVLSSGWRVDACVTWADRCNASARRDCLRSKRVPCALFRSSTRLEAMANLHSSPYTLSHELFLLISLKSREMASPPLRLLCVLAPAFFFSALAVNGKECSSNERCFAVLLSYPPPLWKCSTSWPPVPTRPVAVISGI